VQEDAMPASSRAKPEKRVELANPAIKLDFDPRTSDTMYNYIWVKRPGDGVWERAYNFGVDVRGFKTTDNSVINCVGMNLSLKQSKNAMQVTYPKPLIQYRQFDDKISSPDLIKRYPDFTKKELPSLVHSDAALDFTYELDPAHPSFTVSGKVTSGSIQNITYIIDALWTDNHSLPNRVYFEGFIEFDMFTPEAVLSKEVSIENVAYVIFYRADGGGVPFALLPLLPDKAAICNYYDNWQCLRDFKLSAMNQQFIPDDPAVKDCNDSGYVVDPKPDGTLQGVRVAFFPELGWHAGGTGHELRGKIIDAIKRDYSETAQFWGRTKKGLMPRLVLASPADF
jgi:hypothetical protein